MDFNFDLYVYLFKTLNPKEFIVSCAFYSKLYYEEFAQNALIAIPRVEYSQNWVSENPFNCY